MNILDHETFERLMPTFAGFFRRGLFGRGSFRRSFRRTRRQFFAEGNWKESLTQSELPDDVQAMVRSVVTQTRLFRFEKYEITEELIAHFQDGHQRGQSWEQLLASFGNAAVSARLFRSTRLSNRPIAIKALKFSLWSALTLTIVYLGLFAFYNLARPSIAADYSAKMNEPIESIPQDQKAWPVYRDTWIKYGLNGRMTLYNKFITSVGVDGFEEYPRPGDQQWEAAVTSIKQSQDLLEAIRKGSKLDHLGLALHADVSRYSKEDFTALYPQSEYDNAGDIYAWVESGFGKEGFSNEAKYLMSRSTMGILLPHVQSFRGAASVLIIDSRLAVTQSDPDRVIANVEATLGFARQLYNEPFTTTTVIGSAIFNMAVRHVEEMVNENPRLFSPQQLERLQNSIAKFEVPMQRSFPVERILTKDLIQRIYSDDGNGDGRLTPVGLEVLLMAKTLIGNVDWDGTENYDVPWHQHSQSTRTFFGPAVMLSAPTRKAVTESIQHYNEQIEQAFTANFWDPEYGDLKELEAEKRDEEFIAFVSSFSRVRDALNNAAALQNATVLAIAAKRFHRASGQWPKTLDDLIGDYVDEAPIDRVSGQPLKFRITGDTIIVYSVGVDVDDDGAKHNQWSNPFAFDRPENLLIADTDGDWILWPVKKN